MWAALHQSPIQVLHFRQEAGAAFAAIEAYFASDRSIKIPQPLVILLMVLVI
ncbi:hypothetical protein LC653_07100 [Nostoc sp. CHAB 5784]|uniref:hypothetical protein n=1 Tax=Nostoc mirabile TaxID=2907820 RepID=UPI001E63C9CE|nr:hypothetical protein [Nostoc mirabile]MCC5663697.1 hypothetical protein [Nostoc mirabile CHAB5784]